MEARPWKEWLIWWIYINAGGRVLFVTNQRTKKDLIYERDIEENLLISTNWLVLTWARLAIIFMIIMSSQKHTIPNICYIYKVILSFSSSMGNYMGQQWQYLWCLGNVPAGVLIRKLIGLHLAPIFLFVPQTHREDPGNQGMRAYWIWKFYYKNVTYINVMDSVK